MKIFRSAVYIILSCFAISLFSSCSSSNPGPNSPARIYHSFKFKPHGRIGCFPCPAIGTSFTDPFNLGDHSYSITLSEKNGILYTCKGGNIDLAHVRKSADWTAFLARKVYYKMMKNRTYYKFNFTESSRYYLTINYPENWVNLEKKEKDLIAFDISLELGRYLAYTGTTWHEILTWFGYKSSGLVSEEQSAFSWEDTYSNLLGTEIAVKALRNAKHSYNDAITIELINTLLDLDVKSSYFAKWASKAVRGKWFSYHPIFGLQILNRNFDTGIDDGFVSPSIAEEFSPCDNPNDPSGHDLAVPDLSILDKHGLSIKLEIEPHEWENNRILNIAYHGSTKRKRIEPDTHFPVIIEYIKSKHSNQF